MADLPQPYLDPLNQVLADQFATQPPLESLSVDQSRKTLDEVQDHKPIPGVTRTSFTIPFEDGVKVYVFKPNGAKGDLPVIFYFHGGGWIAGNVHTHDSICRDLALQTGFAVVFVEYTLAPEARYPTQQEQCYATVKWVSEHGHSRGLSQSGFAIAGDSAGGQLSIATSILCSTRKPTIKISYQVLLSPVTDAVTTDRDTPSEFRFFNGPFLTVPFMRQAIEKYIPSPKDRTSELATPQNISAAHAKLQPPTLIIVSSVDPLRDDGFLYGKVLQKNGVDCIVTEQYGQLHDSAIIEPIRDGATPRATVRLVSSTLKEALGSTSNVSKKRVLNGDAEEVEEKETRTRKRRKSKKSY